jgi:hypothetical protein
MAELEPAVDCCPPAAQADCCEPADKDDCCGNGGCGCAVDGTETDRIRERAAATIVRPTRSGAR